MRSGIAVGKLENDRICRQGKNLKMQVEDVSAVSLASQRLAPREPRRDTALTAESAW